MEKIKIKQMMKKHKVIMMIIISKKNLRLMKIYFVNLYYYLKRVYMEVGKKIKNIL